MMPPTIVDGKGPLTVLDSWSSIGDKTVFILDRSKYFTHISSGHSIEGDFSKDPKKSTYDCEPPIQKFDRSLWTCAVEAVVGYSRLVWDLFTPAQKSIAILTVNSNIDQNVLDIASQPLTIEKITSWKDEDQNLDHLLKSLARRSYCHQVRLPNKLIETNDISAQPNCARDSPILNAALEQALINISQLTQSQLDKRSAKRVNQNSSTFGDNNGRVILISSFQDEQCVNQIIDQFESMLRKKNEIFKASLEQDGKFQNSQSCLINYCDLVIVNTFPLTDEGSTSKIGEMRAFRPNLHVKTYSVKSGRFIGGLLSNLCLQHHNLKSTTITGIPMKEEQNASSSSQYDVEIVHCSSIHEEVMHLGTNFLSGIVADIDRNGFPCKTFRLNWCTPKATSNEMHHCIATSRITAVDVNSRPSACLTNFLLNGKQVMLEIYKSKSNRMTTHVLASHGGELYIHSLAASQHKLSLGDPPSMNESLGGRVSDYRINDFVTLIKQNTLLRCPSANLEALSRTCNVIKRQTLYWPVVIGHTILMNITNLVGELLSRFPKESLNQIDVEECKRMIDNLIKSEKEGQGIPSVTIADMIKNNSTKSGVTRLDQLYKLLWNELEYFLRVYSTTPEHEEVLDYLIERHCDKPRTDRGSKRAASKTTAIASPMKKQKVSSKLIPEMCDPAAVEAMQQNSMFYKTGLSLYQTYTHLYHKYHKSKSKLTFIGRLPQSAQDQQQVKPNES